LLYFLAVVCFVAAGFAIAIDHAVRDAQGEPVRRGYAFAVEPKIVLEVAFDIVQRSDLHESGYALRFPRIARIRDDKPASEINTLADVDAIYREMLVREGIAQA